MDINCTHKCFYQHDGKCTLKELPIFFAEQTIHATSDVDCPYHMPSAQPGSGYASLR